MGREKKSAAADLTQLTKCKQIISKFLVCNCDKL